MRSGNVYHRRARKGVLIALCIAVALLAGVLPQAAFGDTSAQSPVSVSSSFPTYPPTPVIASVSAQAFSLVAASDTEYSIDQVNWTSASSFDGLSPKTTYSVWARWSLTHAVCQVPATLTTASTDPIVSDAPALSMPQATKASSPATSAQAATAATSAATAQASDASQAAVVSDRAAIPLLPLGIMAGMFALALILFACRKMKEAGQQS